MSMYSAQKCLRLVLGLATAAGLTACGSDKKADATATCPPNPACSSQMYSLYGDDGFSQVNDAIINNVVAEDKANGIANLGDSFRTHVLAATGADDPPAMFAPHLLGFLKVAYGAPESELGGANADMVSAHKGLAITSAQYDYFVSNIVVPALNQVLTEGNDDIGSCFAPVLTNSCFKASVVGQ